MNTQQKQNLAILTLYCHNLPEGYSHFKMTSFACLSLSNGLWSRLIQTFNPDEVSAHINECGTSACFCGHGPLAGIKPLKGEGWETYGTRCFGAASENESTPLWDWLFHAEHENSIEAACKRAAWVLEGNSLDEFEVDEEAGAEDTFLFPENFRSFQPNWSLIEQIAAK